MRSPRQSWTGHTKTIDVATVEDESGRKEYWGNTINIGFGGSVTIFFPTVRFLRGFPRYILTVLKVIFSNFIIMKNKIKMDEKEFETETIMIALNNGPREGGGFHTGPKAIMDDGELDITIVDKVSRLKMLMLLIPFMNGTQEKDPKRQHGPLQEDRDHIRQADVPARRR